MGKNESLLEGVEMPEAACSPFFYGPCYTADQLRSTVAAAVAKKERDMLESANRNGHLAAAIEIVDALKAENERLRAACDKYSESEILISEKSEPVAWRWGVPKLNGSFEWRYSLNKTRVDAIPLYYATNPPAKSPI